MRCYNGAPDDQLQAVWDSRDKAKAALKRACSAAWCTYFPMEGMYRCARYNDYGRFEELTEFHSSIESACDSAIDFLASLNKQIGEANDRPI
jgi:hypothetical protein